MLGALDVISQLFCDDSQYFDYTLTAVRFWHFKTEATSQGEELYITMNSRGEKLADNEEQKAKILDLPADKLYEWGQKWETWQDFFWKNRNKEKEHNADRGFNEFVRWIKILEGNNSPTPETVEKYFDVIKFLFKKDGVFKNNLDWLSPETENSLIDLFRLLPVVKFVERFGTKTKERNIIRVKQFFKNVARIDNVNKAVNTMLPETIKIIDDLSDSDISLICQQDKVSTVILSIEEKKKLEIYLANPEQSEAIENIFWEAEAHNIWKGEILPLINWATENGVFDLSEFKQYNNVFNLLFHGNLEHSELDKTRRALLTRGLKGYPRVFRGYTNYSFCWEYQEWQILIKDNQNKFGKFLKDLFNVDIDYELQKMIDNNLNNTDYDEFVKIPKLLCFCKQKNIQWDSNSNSWILVAYQKSSGSHANLYTYRLHLDILKYPFWDKNKWSENFWDKGRTCVYLDYSVKHIAIDIYHKTTIINLDTTSETKEIFFQLQLFNIEQATEDDREIVREVATKLDLHFDGSRFTSKMDSKENLLNLLKRVMEKVEKSEP